MEDSLQEEIGICEECGVPGDITRSYTWLNSGAMVRSGNLSRRVGFARAKTSIPSIAASEK